MFLPRLSVLQLLLLACFCALVMGVLRTGWSTPRDEFIRVAYSPDGRLLMTNSISRGIEVWDLERRWPLARRMTIEQSGLHEDPHAIGFLSDDTIFVVASAADQSARQATHLLQWDVRRDRSKANLQTSADGWQCAVALHGSIAVTHQRSKNELTLWDLLSGETLGTVPLPRGVIAFDISNDGKTLAIISGKNTRRVTVWDIESETSAELEVAPDTQTLMFSPQDSYLVTSDGHELAFWDLAGKNMVNEVVAPDGAPGIQVCSAFTPDEATYAYSYFSGGIITMSVPGLEPHAWTLDWVANRPKSIAISPDGSMLAAAHGPSTAGIAIYDLASGEVVRVVGKWNVKRSFALFCMGFIGWTWLWSRVATPSQVPTESSGEYATMDANVMQPPRQAASFFSLQRLRGAFTLLLGVVVVAATLGIMLAAELQVRSIATSAAATAVLAAGSMICCRGFRALHGTQIRDTQLNM